MFLLLCAIKSEQTYNTPNKAFKVSEIFKEWLYQFHKPTEFPWLSKDFNSKPLLVCYSIHYTTVGVLYRHELFVFVYLGRQT